MMNVRFGMPVMPATAPQPVQFAANARPLEGKNVVVFFSTYDEGAKAIEHFTKIGLKAAGASVPDEVSIEAMQNADVVLMYANADGLFQVSRFLNDLDKLGMRHKIMLASNNASLFSKAPFVGLPQLPYPYAKAELLRGVQALISASAA